MTTNPSLPEICDDISKKFPNQKFIITDAYLNGNENIKTYEYNQYQQSVILGYLAGLITTSDMKNINSDKKVGFILSQEYPLITDDIIPGFKEGLQLADKDATADVRIVGNWYDASKASELALSMIDGGVDTFTSIAGGAAEGLYKVAKEKGLYVVLHQGSVIRVETLCCSHVKCQDSFLNQVQRPLSLAAKSKICYSPKYLQE